MPKGILVLWSLFLGVVVTLGVVAVVQDRPSVSAPAVAAVEEAAPRFGPVQESANGAFRMKTEGHPNGDFLTFHVSERMTTERTESLVTISVIGESPNAKFIRDLSELPGVVGIHVRPYEVVIEKAEVFEWPEITAAIATTIRLHLEPRVDITGKTGTSEPHR